MAVSYDPEQIDQEHQAFQLRKLNEDIPVKRGDLDSVMEQVIKKVRNNKQGRFL